MEIIERAPAKINLGSDVLHKRVDGYHEVESIFTSVDLADHLTFENLEEDIIRIETDSSFLSADRRNHVYRAVGLLRRTYNVHKGIKIYIEKRTPVAAGLAGGSSDCAAALRGLNKPWNLGLTMDELCEIGSQIGMDAPCCLGDGTAFANGRGEKIEALPTMSQCWIVLVKPGISAPISTVFNDLAVGGLHYPDTVGLRIATENSDYTRMTQTAGNALESAMIIRHLIVQQIKDRMLKYGADAALMSGSGLTVPVLCEKKIRTQWIYNGLRGSCEEVYLVRILKQIRNNKVWDKNPK